MLVGLAAFGVLFWVYASSLQYAELALVTMGWIVMLQVGLVVLDRVRYGVELPPGKWVAIVVLLAAQSLSVAGPVDDPVACRPDRGRARGGAARVGFPPCSSR